MSKYDRQAKDKTYEERMKVYEDLKILFDRQIRLLEMQSAMLIGLVKSLGFDVAVDILDDDLYDDFLDDDSDDVFDDDFDNLNKTLKDSAVDNSEIWDFSYDQKTAHSKPLKR